MTITGGARLVLVNTGSSSVKLTVWGDDRPLQAESLGRDDTIDLARFAAPHGPVAAVVHRIVHAGDVQCHAVITPAVEAAIRASSPLAPLHNPVALRAIAAARTAFPGVPQLAAVDTALFADLPAEAATYALGPEVGPVRRYGFHGLAHAFLARRCRELDPGRSGRLVTLQLGAGCSATAIRDGRAVDTSMGFSPSEGLMMATRSGDIDPGLLLHLLRAGHSVDDVDRLINQRGGLLGVAGNAAMPQVLRLAATGHAGAELALALYCYRVRKIVGAYAAVLGGLDCVAFGGGVGQNAVEIRKRILEPLAWIGLELDAARNASNRQDAAITSAASRVSAWVVRVDEASEMVRIAAALLRSA